MSLGAALAKKFQTSLRKVNHLALVFLFRVRFRLNLSTSNRSNMLNNILGLADKTDEALVLRLK